jgi:hypothetical protein
VKFVLTSRRSHPNGRQSHENPELSLEDSFSGLSEEIQIGRSSKADRTYQNFPF